MPASQADTSRRSPPDLRRFYKTSERYVTRLLALERSSFSTFCGLVRRFSTDGGIVLEIGPGGGQAAASLAAVGVRVVAMDLSHLFLCRARDAQRCEGEQPHLVAGDGTSLPFATEAFDVVCVHDVIEHIAEQEALWAEVVRVLKRGGHVIVVGPNLLSPINTLLYSLQELRRGRLPHELWALTLKYAWITAQKLWLSDSSLRYRVVTVREDMHSDQDACYMASPIDVRRLLERNRCKVIRYQRDSRTALGRAVKCVARSFAPSIWIVAVKPLAERHS